MVDSVTSHGWTAVPRDASILLTSVGNVGNIEPVKVNEVWLPDTEQARKVLEYARRELTEETFNHSMRVYYYGTARCAPSPYVFELTTFDSE